MEVSHAYLAEVARVVLVKVDAVVVLTSSIAAAAWVLAVLANAPAAGGDLAAVVAVREVIELAINAMKVVTWQKIVQNLAMEVVVVVVVEALVAESVEVVAALADVVALVEEAVVALEPKQKVPQPEALVAVVALVERVAVALVELVVVALAAEVDLEEARKKKEEVEVEEEIAIIAAKKVT